MSKLEFRICTYGLLTVLLTGTLNRTRDRNGAFKSVDDGDSPTNACLAIRDFREDNVVSPRFSVLRSHFLRMGLKCTGDSKSAPIYGLTWRLRKSPTRNSGVPSSLRGLLGSLPPTSRVPTLSS